MQYLCDAIHELSADVQVVAVIDLADAGRAGDIDLREVVTNDIQAYEQQAQLSQRGAHLVSNPAVPLGQGLGPARAAGGQVAPGLAHLGDAGQAIGYCFAR